MAAQKPRGNVRARAGVARSVRSASTQRRGSGKVNFPFVRIAGQEDLKLALILSLIDPRIGGVLIMGERGTGKSTTVRALVDLLPDIEVVKGDPFNSSADDPEYMSPYVKETLQKGESVEMQKIGIPMVELPLGATEDRICGTIDIEKALTEGIKAYEPGLLAKANRGILYVDEVNLLDDSLVDVVLDSAASGVNTVEREGVSIVHPAKFILIGSGNPSEGELRPQLLDRFGTSATVSTLVDDGLRVQMVKDRMAFEKDPEGFCLEHAAETEAVRQRVTEATSRLPQVKIPRELSVKIAEVCAMVDIDGLRGDIVVNRAAKAFVALEGRDEVTAEDIQRIIGLCLNHRMRKDPMDPIDNGVKVEIAFQRVFFPGAAEAAAEAKRKQEEEVQAAEASEESGADRKGLKAGAWDPRSMLGKR
eukprot:CAMPEP_0183833388 /NCGR_PEP_ID=MMETSP0807_2-20130328/6036_1 /TAXON_ID=88271 /ORGANISM="Picocystis salinarum, Strain CCMP1897" /LENGTH=419 /DNA_ID=CAMNT_0026079331 /DNA_START=28 /DNA_END=1287 /DNA_ORIENTATION=+